jgi:hypothetical protein
MGSCNLMEARCNLVGDKLIVFDSVLLITSTGLMLFGTLHGLKGSNVANVRAALVATWQPVCDTFVAPGDTCLFLELLWETGHAFRSVSRWCVLRHAPTLHPTLNNYHVKFIHIRRQMNLGYHGLRSYSARFGTGTVWHTEQMVRQIVG